MTSLEQTLASVLDAIEQARSTGQSHALPALLQRQRAICAALAAPEQSWLEPPVQAARRVQPSQESRDRVQIAALSGPAL